MTVFLSIGSNLEPKKNVPAAIEALKKKFRVKKISSIYETDPVGPAGSQKFWNLAVELETALDKEKLTEELRKVEAALGRQRHAANRFAPRTIDLDILPQPDYTQQAFIMIPLSEIAPENLDTESGKSFGEIAEGLRKEAEKFRKILFAGGRT